MDKHEAFGVLDIKVVDVAVVGVVAVGVVAVDVVVNCGGCCGGHRRRDA